MPENNRDIVNRPSSEKYKTSKGKTYFLAIGINQYKNFSKLNNAVKDVIDIGKLLHDNYGFEEK